jgi:hypothetical protein
MSITTRSLLFSVFKTLLGLGLAWALFVEISREGKRACEVCVHVSAADVDVKIGEDIRHVSALQTDSPLVYQLKPGRHRLEVRRQGRLVYDENFEIDAGDDLILAAGERPVDAEVAAAIPMTTLAQNQMPTERARRFPPVRDVIRTPVR